MKAENVHAMSRYDTPDVMFSEPFRRGTRYSFNPRAKPTVKKRNPMIARGMR